MTEIERVVELTCVVQIDSGQSPKVLALKYNGRTWDRLDITEYLPAGEMCRLLSEGYAKREVDLHKKGRKLGLW